MSRQIYRRWRRLLRHVVIGDCLIGKGRRWSVFFLQWLGPVFPIDGPARTISTPAIIMNRNAAPSWVACVGSRRLRHTLGPSLYRARTTDRPTVCSTFLSQNFPCTSRRSTSQRRRKVFRRQRNGRGWGRGSGGIVSPQCDVSGAFHPCWLEAAAGKDRTYALTVGGGCGRPGRLRHCDVMPGRLTSFRGNNTGHSYICISTKHALVQSIGVAIGLLHVDKVTSSPSEQQS